MNVDLAQARALRVRALRECVRPGPIMVVNLDAITGNYQQLARMTAGHVAAVVKGDGYGHGMIPAAIALASKGADTFFTARLDDAFVLRKVLPAQCIVSALDGTDAANVAETIAAGIVPVVNGPEQLAALLGESGRYQQRLPAYLHIDTAMNRLGFSADELEECIQAISMLDVRAYMTHFASADDLDIDLCRQQVATLKTLIRQLPWAPLSIANSCGVFLGTEFHGDLIRPGKSTFGINPLPTPNNPMCEPAQVWAPVVQIRQIKRGDAVGYSETWRASCRSRIAILAIGYSAGYRRSASNRGYVAFEGHRAPVIGRVSMDLTAVDVTELSHDLVQNGSFAEVLGPTIRYRDIADHESTNEHEALIALGAGCRRVHLSVCN